MATEPRNNLRHGDGYFVRRPRPTDAVGYALRSAYGEAEGLPDEFARALAALDQAKPRH